MSLIAATNSSAYNALTSLLNDGTASSALTNKSTSASKFSPDDSASQSSSNPTDVVDLSDSAKAIVARAKVEKAIADRLQAQLDLLKSKGSNDPSKTSKNSFDIQVTSFDFFVSISKEGTKDHSSSFGVVAPKVNFSSSISVGEFTISARGDSDTWSSDIEVDGPSGFEYASKVFGGGKGKPTASWQGGGYPLYGPDHPPAFVGGYYDADNNKKYITIGYASAAAATVSTDDVTAGVASAEYHSITFAVDFNTGSISVLESDASLTEAFVGFKQPKKTQA